ncbi:hypothetical protein [Amycolatopsis sp. cmx-11-12]|uniref:hypothetical protein n=1 Tax=Amycolatopsis sp. cmx-11-12 TaxID=2785795 RepID=UPI00391700C0
MRDDRRGCFGESSVIVTHLSRQLMSHFARAVKGIAVCAAAPTPQSRNPKPSATERQEGSGGNPRCVTTDLADLPVLRQDAATHPGTCVNGILADPL